MSPRADLDQPDACPARAMKPQVTAPFFWDRGTRATLHTRPKSAHANTPGGISREVTTHA